MSEALTDWNDLASVAGADVVRDQIDAGMAAAHLNGVGKGRTFPPLDEDVSAGTDALHDHAQHQPDDAGQGQTLEPESWPDPVLPGSACTPDVAAHDVLEGWLADYVHHLAESTQTPPIMGVLAALATLATCVQGRYEIAPTGSKTYREPLSLWVCTAMPPGSRKSAVMNGIIGPLIHWEKLLADRMRKSIASNQAQRITTQKRIESLTLKAGKAETDKDVDELRRQIEDLTEGMPDELLAPRLFTGDTTIERLQNLLVEQRGRMAVHSDEGGMFATLDGLYSGGNVNLDAVLGGHAGSPLRVDRAGRKAHVDRPALSFNLMTQPGVFGELASKSAFRHSGLLARFLFGMPVSTVGRRNVRHQHDIPDEVAQAYDQNIKRLLDGWIPDPAMPRKTVILGVTDAGRELWFDFAQRLEDHQGQGGTLEGIADWTSKAPGAAARVAALLELAEFGVHAECVSESAMRRAIALMDKLIPHAQAAMGMLGADPVDQDAEAVLRWLVARGEPEVKRQAIHNSLSWRFKNLDKLSKALDKLKANGCIETRQVRNKGARPSVLVTLNPKVVEFIRFVQ